MLIPLRLGTSTESPTPTVQIQTPLDPTGLLLYASPGRPRPPVDKPNAVPEALPDSKAGKAKKVKFKPPIWDITLGRIVTRGHNKS